MADKRLIDFNEKPLPAGDDIVYIGDQSDSYRENRTTFNQFNSFKGFLEVSASRDVLSDFLGKNIVSNSVTDIVLSIQLNPGIPIGSQFVMIRNTVGAFDLQAVAGVTINGIDAALVNLSDQYDRAVITNISNNEWSFNKYARNFTGTPNRVAITNASGEIDTSDFLKYTEGSAQLEAYDILTGSIQSLGAAKIFQQQNTVNADRALVQGDLGVLLSNGGVGKINLPAAGDTSIPPTSAFDIWDPSGVPLTVQAPAGVSIDGVDGGSIMTVGAGSVIRIIRSMLSPTTWYSTQTKLTPSRVAISNASGDTTTSDFLKYTEGPEQLEAYNILTSSIQSTGWAKIFQQQNSVNADRALVQDDLGVLLSNGSVGKINLPASGDTSLSARAAFDIWDPSGVPLTVQAPAGVSIDGVDGGSVTTSGSGSVIRLIRNLFSPDTWHSTKSVDSIHTFQEIYDNDASANITTAPSKPLTLTSETNEYALGLKSTLNTSDTLSLGIFTSLATATPGFETAEWAVTGLRQGAQTPIVAWEGVQGRLSFFGNQPGFVRMTGSGSGFIFSCDQEDIGNSVTSLGFGGNNNAQASRGYGKIETVIQSNVGGVNGKTIFSVAENNFGWVDDTTPYFELDGLSKTIRNLKPLENFNMTDAEFKAVLTPAKGLSAFITDSDRIGVNKGTPGAPLYDTLAYLSDIPPGVSPGYGEMYFNDNVVETEILSPATPVKINATYSDGNLSGFSHSGGTLTRTGASDTFKITASLSCTLGSSSQTVSVFIYKNGAVVAKSKQQQLLGPVSPGAQNISCSALMVLNTNDNIEVWIQNDGGFENIVVKQLNCIPEELAGGAGSTNVVTKWNGAVTPVEVTAGANVDITSGVISVPGIDFGNSGLSIASTVGFLGGPSPSISSQYYTKIGNIVTFSVTVFNMKKAALAPLTYIIFDVPFTPTFSATEHANGEGTVGPSNASLPGDTSRVGQVAAIPPNQVRVDFFIEEESPSPQFYAANVRIVYEIQ